MVQAHVLFAKIDVSMELPPLFQASTPLKTNMTMRKTAVWRCIPFWKKMVMFHCYTRWWCQKKDFYPYLGRLSNLTNIFQMGWNHQLVYYFFAGCMYIRISARDSRLRWSQDVRQRILKRFREFVRGSAWTMLHWGHGLAWCYVLNCIVCNVCIASMYIYMYVYIDCI